MAKKAKKFEKNEDSTKNNKKNSSMTAEQYMKALLELNRWQGVLLRHLQDEIV